MKKILLYLVLLMLCFGNCTNIIFGETLTDTTSVKYIPLAVGNVYKYHFSSSGGMNYDYKCRISRDTIIDSKKYYVFSGYYSGLNRYDSLTGNYYKRSASGYCSYSPNEVLVDSLASRKRDTTKNCVAAPYKRICTDTNNGTLFGIIVKSKSFTQYGFEGSESFTYCTGFGRTNYTTQDIGGFGAEWLVGCYINGILYGDTILTEITNLNTGISDKFALYQNYPNPFNPSTKIKFDIPAPHLYKGGQGGVSLKVFDILGKEITTLVNEKLNPGTYEVTFDGSNFASGIYFYQLKAGEFFGVKKLVLLK